MKIAEWMAQNDVGPVTRPYFIGWEERDGIAYLASVNRWGDEQRSEIGSADMEGSPSDIRVAVRRAIRRWAIGQGELYYSPAVLNRLAQSFKGEAERQELALYAEEHRRAAALEQRRKAAEEAREKERIVAAKEHAKDQAILDIARAKIAAKAEANAALRFANRNRARRSNVAWRESVPDGVAKSQESWERLQTVAAMIAAGLSQKEVASRLFLASTGIAQMREKHARRAKHPLGNRSPVERYWEAENRSKPTRREARGMLKALGGLVVAPDLEKYQQMRPIWAMRGDHAQA